MKVAELRQIMAAAGWRHKRDEAGDTCSVFALSDRTVQVIAGIDHLADRQRLRSTLSLSTPVFSCVYMGIQGLPEGHAPLCVHRQGLSLEAPLLTAAEVARFTDAALDWARSTDPAEALARHVALPTHAPGTGPMLHLAALAVTGAIDRLQTYQRAFAAGDRLGFVPYVTQDHIARSLALCAVPPEGEAS